MGRPKTKILTWFRLGDALVPLLARTVPLTFFGHTHLQGGFFANGDSADGFRPEYRTVGKAESIAFHFEAEHAVPAQPWLRGPAAGFGLAVGIRFVRYRSAGLPLSPHALQFESGARSNYCGQPSAAPGDSFGCWAMDFSRTISFSASVVNSETCLTRVQETKRWLPPREQNPPAHYLVAH